MKYTLTNKKYSLIGFFLQTKYLLAICLCLPTLTSAQKFIKFERKENVFTSKKPISSVYKSKSEINVILRNTAYDFNSNQGANRYSSNLFFNIIEKEFIKYGINVKDAALFKIDAAGKNTDVDLMIDLASITRVEFNTNRYYTKNGEERTTEDLKKVNFAGYSFDFRIVDAQNNEVLGFYSFNFTPCAEGCEVRIGKASVEFVEKKYEKFKGSYEMNNLEDNVFSDFYREVANHLIKELKKNTNVASLVDESNIDFLRAKSNVDKYFPESHFFDNLQSGLISKSRKIYIYSYGGESIESDVVGVLSSKGYEVTNDKHQAGYYLFVYKGKMLKTGPDPNCIQFQFIDAKTLEKLSGANYKYRRSDMYLEEYIEMFVDSL